MSHIPIRNKFVETVSHQSTLIHRFMDPEEHEAFLKKYGKPGVTINQHEIKRCSDLTLEESEL